MKCQKCGRDIPKDESREHQGKTLCDDCYIDAISKERECDPWATYLTARERGNIRPGSTEILNDLQKTIHDFIKRSGKATRKQVMARVKLSAAELDPHIRVLMHAELVKERSEGGTIYLIPIHTD